MLPVYVITWTLLYDKHIHTEGNIEAEGPLFCPSHFAPGTYKGAPGGAKFCEVLCNIQSSLTLTLTLALIVQACANYTA